jgi:hypothetical protein
MLYLGLKMLKVPLLAFEETNAKGGGFGKKAKVIVRDEQANPGVAATRANEPIEKDKVLVGGNPGATVPDIHGPTAPNQVSYIVALCPTRSLLCQLSIRIR